MAWGAGERGECTGHRPDRSLCGSAARGAMARQVGDHARPPPPPRGRSPACRGPTGSKSRAQEMHNASRRRQESSSLARRAPINSRTREPETEHACEPAHANCVTHTWRRTRPQAHILTHARTYMRMATRGRMGGEAPASCPRTVPSAGIRGRRISARAGASASQVSHLLTHIRGGWACVRPL